jgi:hypothetical protein
LFLICSPHDYTVASPRELLLLAGAMTAARPLRAQQKAMPVIGYLNSASPRPGCTVCGRVRRLIIRSPRQHSMMVAGAGPSVRRSNWARCWGPDDAAASRRRV